MNSNHRTALPQSEGTLSLETAPKCPLAANELLAVGGRRCACQLLKISGLVRNPG